MTQKRKTPIRTCVSCRTPSGKADLIRVVRTPDGEVRIDATGKMAGRGAYLCGRKECVELATKQNRLGRALRCPIPERVIAQIRDLVEKDAGE